MKKLLTLLLAVAAVGAYADDSMSMANSGSSSSSNELTNLYVGVGAGAAWNNVSYPAASLRADVGYNFNDYWAVELGTLGIAQSGTGTNQSMEFYDLSLKGTLPLSDTFAVFAQLGGAYGSPGSIGNLSAYASNQGALQAGWDFFSAAGIQVNVTRQVAFNLGDYYYYGAPNPQGNTNVVLAGFKYNF